MHRERYNLCIADAVEEDIREMEELDAGPVVAGVEEIRVERQDCASPADCRHVYYSWMPFAALRVLEMTGCLLRPHPNPPRFPCLEAMRFWRCRTKIATLEDMISAAPRLADLRLEAVCFEDDEHVYRLRCPAATVIVIADMHTFSSQLHFSWCRVELDAPCLRRVTLQVNYFSFEPLVPPGLEQVDLSVHVGSTLEVEACRSFLASVPYVRFLKLTAYSMADLDGLIQYNLYNLEVLEIEELCGWCICNYGDMANALGNLLRRCPGLRELRLKFSWCKYLGETTDPAVLSAAMSDFLLCRSLANAGDDGDQDCCDRLDIIHKICGGCKPDCFQSSLTMVVVQFDADELTCFQVRLIKFLAKNAMALEKLVVDGGKGYNSSHIDRKILRWGKRRRRTPDLLPPMTHRPLWPPPLSEFPPLGRAPDPNIAAMLCSQAPAL